MATEFNKTFLNKVKKLKESIDGPITNRPEERLQDWLDSRESPIPEFSLKEINEEQLMEYILKMSGGKSFGTDKIDSFSLKLAAPFIKDVLLHIINLSISQHKFSKLWKTQLIHPLYKKGNKTLGENYRPVSHLVELSKLVERAVADQVLQHFLQNDLFHPNHHGFLPHHSCATALIQLYDEWLTIAENQELIAALLLDLSAAYDLVPHDLLLKKLKLYKFDEGTINFFKSYLENRQQRVQVESKISEPQKIGDIALPQGSVIAGLLFVIFQNDFPAQNIVTAANDNARNNNMEEVDREDVDENITHEGESILFADDNTHSVHDANPDVLERKHQVQANRSTEWIRDNEHYVFFSGKLSNQNQDPKNDSFFGSSF